MHTSSQDEEALLKELSKLEEMLKAQFSETENLSFRLEKEEQKQEVTVFTEETVNLLSRQLRFFRAALSAEPEKMWKWYRHLLI